MLLLSIPGPTAQKAAPKSVNLDATLLGVALNWLSEPEFQHMRLYIADTR
jgi:hypothetical protein